MISIDPGNEAGIAVFEDGVLVRVELVLNARERRWKWNGQKGHHVVCEYPQVYFGQRKKDLASLAATARYLTKQMKPAKVDFVFPREWKGQRPKSVDNALTRRLLSDQERRIVDDAEIASRLLHNVIDAIGIGLWTLKRR